MRVAALLLLPLLLLPACGDDDVVEPAPAGAVTPDPDRRRDASPSPVASAVPTAVATPQAARSPVAAAAAGAVESEPARRAPAAQGDVDGDGRPDEIALGGRTVLVTLSGGRQVVSGEVEHDLDGEPRVAGVEDVDRDGRAEVFVQVGRGASTAFLQPLRYSGGSLAPLRVDGAAVLLGVGGGATHGEGFSCTDEGTLVVRSASTEDGASWTVTTTAYRVDGHRLVQLSRSTGRATADDPLVGQSYLVDCRSVGEGG